MQFGMEKRWRFGTSGGRREEKLPWNVQAVVQVRPAGRPDGEAFKIPVDSQDVGEGVGNSSLLEIVQGTAREGGPRP